VNEGRAYLEEQLRQMKLEFVPATANFVMVKVGDGAAVFKKLALRKIIVRPIGNYGLPEWIRISVGTMEQNRKCVVALKETLEDSSAAVIACNPSCDFCDYDQS